MLYCGERPPRFDKYCDGKFFVGGFKSLNNQNCNIVRDIQLGYFEPFIIISNAKLMFENKWRGESLNFKVNDIIKIKKPTFRVDFHRPLCEGDSTPDRIEDIYVVYKMEKFLNSISLSDNFFTFAAKHLNWGFRDFFTSVILCPPGAEKDLENAVNFTCKCQPGFYRDFKAEFFTCRELSYQCSRGDGPSAANCTECFFPFTKPDYDPKGECILNDCKEN
jgi:hypothetical protein